MLDSCGLRRPPYRRPPRRSRPCRRTTSRRSHVSALRRKLFATARPTNATRTLTTGWIECCCLSVCVISPSCLRDLPVFHLLLTRNALQRYGLLVLSHALPYLCAFSSVISLSLYISCLIFMCHALAHATGRQPLGHYLYLLHRPFFIGGSRLKRFSYSSTREAAKWAL